MIPITVICGPTASGKSALAVDLARKNDGVIINADSMQIYDALPLLTARPTAEEQSDIPHRLYAAIAPEERCSARLWRDMAVAEIAKTLEAGRHPVVVGGTGLYLKALVTGLSEMPDVPPEIRQLANDRQREMGNPQFHADLAQRDPVMAARLNPNDTQRLIRAWEVFEATGESLAQWQDTPLQGPPAGWAFRIIIATPPRDVLHQRCDARFDSMIESGALEEARDLQTRIAAGDIPADAPVTLALGFRPLSRYLSGEISRDEAVMRAKADTRQYAKRQDTWFRHQIVPAAHIEEITRVP